MFLSLCGIAAVIVATYSDSAEARRTRRYPSVQWQTSSQTVSESAGILQVTAVLSTASNTSVTIPYSLSGTAMPLNDYIGASGSLIIPVGGTSASVSLQLINDTAVEPPESLILTMGTPVGANKGASTIHTITIVDNDVAPAPTPTATVAPAPSPTASPKPSPTPSPTISPKPSPTATATPVVINTGNCPLGATCFYVAGSGDDTNGDGSVSKPWKTIRKINSATFAPGSYILFNRGDTWRETLVPPSSGTSGSPITFSAYGSGANPILSGSDLVTSWSMLTTNIWQASVATQPNILYFDGKRGQRVASSSAITASYQWYWVSGVLSVYAPSNVNPSTTYRAIEAGSRANNLLTNNRAYLTFDSLTFRDANGVNFDRPSISVGKTTVQGIKIQNSVIERNKTTGIYVVGSPVIASFTVHNCLINDNGAFGILLEGNSTSTEISDSKIIGNGWASLELAQQMSGIQGNLSGVHIFGNTIANSAPGVAESDSRSHGIYGGDYTGVADIHDNIVYGNPNGAGIKTHSSANIYNNISYGNRLEGIELGWNAAINAVYNVHHNICYGSTTGFPGLFVGSKGTGTITLTVENNVFYKSGTVSSEISIENDLNGVTIKNNVFYAAAGRPSIYLVPQTGPVSIDYNLSWRDDGVASNRYGSSTLSWSQWRGMGFDTHALNANPLFVNPSVNDFHLQSTSPAIDSGIDVGLPYTGRAPDIGAYEW